RFGDTSISATASNAATSSVYASVDPNNPDRMIVVAINRSTQPQNAAIAISDSTQFALAQVFQLTSASASPVQVAGLTTSLGNHFSYLMPASSVTTLVLTTLPGDYDGNGAVNADDYTLWRKSMASGTPLPHGDTSPGVGLDDYVRWRSHFGNS